MTKETSTGWEEEIPALKIEKLADGSLMLTAEDHMGNGDDIVLVHPLHLRFMAEKMGLAREMSASEADALRMVDKLARRMDVLHQRISQVHEWMWQNKDFEQCDITVEAWYIDATLDMVKEFITEIEESRAVVTPRHAESRQVLPAAATQGQETPSNAGEKPNGFPKANPSETQSVSGTASAKSPVKGPSPLFDGGAL